MAAVVIAVGAVTAIGFFSDRLNRAMTYQSADLLGADLRLTSPEPVPPGWLKEAVGQGLRQAETLGHRHQDQPAVPHAAFRDDVIREVLDLLDRAAQHRDLHAAVVVGVHVQRRERQVVMLVCRAGQAPR